MNVTTKLEPATSTALQSHALDGDFSAPPI